MTKLSEHFTLEEMIRSELAARWDMDNTPGPTEIANLKRLCIDVLEPVRAIWKKPIAPSSGYRSFEVNRLAGGAKTSQHLTGCACDFVIAGIPLKTIMNKIIASNIPFDQLIFEYGQWIHISTVSKKGNKPRRMALQIFAGTGCQPYNPKA